MLARMVPGPLLRFFARPYVAGGTMADALDRAETLLANNNQLSTLDLLGEGVTTDRQVQANREAYLELISAIAKRFADDGNRPTVSVKPSAFTTGDQMASFEVIEVVCRHAQLNHVGMTIDMEDHPWTDITLTKAIDLYNRGFDVGTVVQTRLHRTQADLERFPTGMRVRLVIGIYPEPVDIATADKTVMKERLLTAAQQLLNRGVRVEFATHDEPTLERFARDIAPTAPEQCEIQMLLGVPRASMQSKLQGGELGPALPVRLYVPFAIGWSDATAYLRRRMVESPNMILPVLKNLLNRDRQ